MARLSRTLTMRTKNMTKAEIVKRFKKARALIVKGWCKGWHATTESGKCVDWDNPKAVKFCPSAACVKAKISMEERMKYLKFPIKFGCLTAWNDAKSRKKSQVVAAFDRAIALAKKS